MRALPALAFVPPDEVVEALHEVAAHLPDEAADVVDYFEATYVGRDVAGRFRPPRSVIPFILCD